MLEMDKWDQFNSITVLSQLFQTLCWKLSLYALLGVYNNIMFVTNTIWLFRGNPKPLMTKHHSSYFTVCRLSCPPYAIKAHKAGKLNTTTTHTTFFLYRASLSFNAAQHPTLQHPTLQLWALLTGWSAAVTTVSGYVKFYHLARMPSCFLAIVELPNYIFYFRYI